MPTLWVRFPEGMPSSLGSRRLTVRSRTLFGISEAQVLGSGGEPDIGVACHVGD